MTRDLSRLWKGGCVSADRLDLNSHNELTRDKDKTKGGLAQHAGRIYRNIDFEPLTADLRGAVLADKLDAITDILSLRALLEARLVQLYNSISGSDRQMVMDE
jgi:hypothetical protein